MKWITATDFRRWQQRKCQDQMPLLIRKLIRATTTQINQIQFPAGDNVVYGGWDGVLLSNEGTAKVPLGTSLWEIGTGSDYKAKANIDYEKRKLDPLGYDPNECTYVFVTQHIWTSKSDWIKEKNAEGIWKEVRVYDGQDLEEWLDEAPSVGAWLATEQLGKHTLGVQAADDFWKRWATGKSINFTPAVVLAGRMKESTKLIDLAQTPNVIPLQAATREEAIAFILASFKTGDALEEDFFSRALIIDNTEAFNAAMLVEKQTFLIPRFVDDDLSFNKAVQDGHVVLMPMDADHTGNWSNQIILPPLERVAFVEALNSIGIQREKAEAISIRSARNMAVLRRQLEFTRLKPSWATLEHSRDLIPALLAERWDENSDKDKAAIETLAGMAYEKYVAALTKWLKVPDAPVIKIGSKWRLTSPLDAWIHIGRFCVESDFAKLKALCLEVYSEIDPKLDQKDEDFLKIPTEPTLPMFSGWLKEGVLQSLILISVYGEQVELEFKEQCEDWVDQVIATVLAKEDPAIWKTFSLQLPLFAEASPAMFTRRMEQLINTEKSAVYSLFEEKKGFFNTAHYHTGLLWALENIAWIPEYLTRMTLILAKLSAKDAAIKMTNKPGNSLKEIFKAWHPQTLATLDQRIESLNTLAKKFPIVAKQVIKGLLPIRGDIAHGTHRMRFRLSEEAIPERATYNIVFKTQEFAVEKLLAWFEPTEEGFTELLKASVSLNPREMDKALTLLDEQAPSIHFETNDTWDWLRHVIARHRAHQDKDWSIKEAFLKRYDHLYLQLTPKDPLEQQIWKLTESFIETIAAGDLGLSYTERAKRNQQAKIEVVASIYQEHGVEKLIALVDRIPLGALNNYAAAVAEKIDNPADLIKIYEGLKTEGKLLSFAQFVAARKGYVNGFAYITKLFEELKELHFDREALANLLCGLASTKQLCDFVAQQDVDFVEYYWKNIEGYSLYMEADEVPYAIGQLMKFGRYTTALQVAHMVTEKLPSKLIVDVLTNLISNEPEQNVRFDEYQITHSFEELRRRNDIEHSTMIVLEWTYLPLMGMYLEEGTTPLLHKEMSINPDFFIQVLQQVYGYYLSTSENEEVEEDEEVSRRNYLLYSHAKELFTHWKDIPGVADDGTIDKIALKSWTDIVLHKAKELNLLSYAEAKIGYILAQYPEVIKKTGDEEASVVNFQWPPDEICEVMEEINSAPLFDGFWVSTWNKRSGFTKLAFDGGDREHTLAEYFKKLAEAKSGRYPLVADVLMQLSRAYRGDAKTMDEEAMIRRLDY